MCQQLHGDNKNINDDFMCPGKENNKILIWCS